MNSSDSDSNVGGPVKISAIVMTYNEEGNIARCLESLEEVADEILIVDSHSTDRTLEIARSFGARILLHPFEGFIEQRNYSIEHANYDFVLAVDADEALSLELIQEINRIKRNWKADAYIFNRSNHFCGKFIRHGLWYPDRKLRLWDRRKGRVGGINPHDRIFLNPGYRTKKLKGDLLHYTVWQISEYVDQINHFSSIQAEQLIKLKMRPNPFHLYIKPFYKFVLAYFIRLGFLDGWRGFCIAVGQAWGIYLRYIKVIDQRRQP